MYPPFLFSCVILASQRIYVYSHGQRENTDDAIRVILRIRPKVAREEEEAEIISLTEGDETSV